MIYIYNGGNNLDFLVIFYFPMNPPQMGNLYWDYVKNCVEALF